jgi:hypothetical protein
LKRIILAMLVAGIAVAANAAPAAATVKFAGECSFDGASTFGVPLKFVPQEMDWSFDTHPNGGKCTGLLNGQLVQDTPVSAHVDAHGPISCGVLGSSLDAPFVATFSAITSGDNQLSGRLSLAAVAAQNAVAITGDEGGQAAGRASFFGQNDQVAVAQGCLDGNTVTSLNVNVTVATAPTIKG